MIHGFTFFYAMKQCDGEANVYLQLPQPIHDSFCCKDCEVQGYGNIERYLMILAAFIAIGANVVPKYWKGDEAVRHMVHVKKRKIMNPLLFHIIFGILTVVVGALMSIAPPAVQNDKLMLGLLIFSDVGHQISIHRLLKNHDGIWTLRPGNMQLAIMKWIVLLRVGDRQTMIDMVFFQSCGFLGTRVFATLVYTFMYFGIPTYLFEENWYSIGLMGAQFWIYARFWEVAAPVAWISIISSSALYFHQLWRKYLPVRDAFTFMNCMAMTYALSLPKHLSLAFTLAYWCIFFFVPGFKRQPLPGHLVGTMKKFKETSNEAREDRQMRMMARARKNLVDPQSSKKSRRTGMQNMTKFLNVTEFRTSCRASALALLGLSA